VGVAKAILDFTGRTTTQWQQARLDEKVMSSNNVSRRSYLHEQNRIVIASPPEVLSKLSSFTPIVSAIVRSGANRAPLLHHRERDQLVLVKLLKVVYVG